MEMSTIKDSMLAENAVFRYIFCVLNFTFSEQTIIERVPKYIQSVLYYTRERNKLSNRCNFCSSKVL